MDAKSDRHSNCIKEPLFPPDPIKKLSKYEESKSRTPLIGPVMDQKFLEMF